LVTYDLDQVKTLVFVQEGKELNDDY